nr:MAG TPA_asm: hypothetical protein [Caudoviricetes sp.]
MASTAGLRVCERVGARNGRAGWLERPCSRTLAIKALERPSERFSAKPTFTLWSPRLLTFTVVVPSAASSCPVEREGCLVPEPIAAARFARIRGSTTPAPACRTSSADDSRTLPVAPSESMKVLGRRIWTLAMAVSFRFNTVCQNLDIPTHNLNRINHVPAASAGDLHGFSNSQPRYYSNAEEHVSLAVGRPVHPRARSVTHLDIGPHRGDNLVVDASEPGSVLCNHWCYQVDVFGHSPKRSHNGSP